jgi:hypothetical protein
MDRQIEMNREFKISAKTMTKEEKRINRQEMQAFKSVDKQVAIRNLSCTPIAPRSTNYSPKTKTMSNLDRDLKMVYNSNKIPTFKAVKSLRDLIEPQLS